MNVGKIWAEAAVDVALQPWTTPAERRRHLSTAAKLSPDTLRNKIAKLREQIAILERHLPGGREGWREALALLRHFADTINERNYADKRLYLLQHIDRLLASPSREPADTEETAR